MKAAKHRLRVPEVIRDLPMQMQAEYHRFIDHQLKVCGISVLTINNRVGNHSARFLAWLHFHQGRTSCDGITAMDYLAFLQSLPQRKLNYMQKFRQSLRAFMRWQVLLKMVDHEEMQRFEMAKMTGRHYQTKPVRALTEWELIKLFENIEKKWPYNPRQVDRYARGIKLGETTLPKLRQSIYNVQATTMVIVVLETGLRVDELTRLTIHDVDPIQETIQVLGKGGKWRTLPYSPGLREQMKLWLGHRDMIVDGEHTNLWISMYGGHWGKPMSYENIEEMIKRIYQGDITGVAWHVLRKTFATMRHRTGEDIEITSKLLGHNSIATTELYLEVDKEQVVQDALKHSPIVTDKYNDIRQRAFKRLQNAKKKEEEDALSTDADAGGEEDAEQGDTNTSREQEPEQRDLLAPSDSGTGTKPRGLWALVEVDHEGTEPLAG